MFSWIFWATVLTHWTSRCNPTAARVRRARSAKPSFPLGRNCMFLRHDEVSMLPWTSDMDEHWSARLISWLLKQNRDPTWYYMYPIMAQFPCICILIHMVWPISQHIWWCYADQHVLIVIVMIYVHVVAFVFLGKRCCQRVTALSSPIYMQDSPKMSY